MNSIKNIPAGIIQEVSEIINCSQNSIIFSFSLLVEYIYQSGFLLLS